MTKAALVVGGTGPTGPHIVEGLLDRGYRVTEFHRGTHEVPFAADVEHVHGDPHFEESATESLGQRSFEVAVVTYGRTRLLAQVLAGRCGHFIGIGATNVYKGASNPEGSWPTGTRLQTTEDGPLVSPQPSSDHPAELFAEKIYATECKVLELAAQGAFKATYFRYPVIYGPRNIIPWEWSVVRRLQDGRKFIVVCDEGLMIRTRMACRNAAHAVLLAVDQPETSDGRTYNCADDQQYSLHQWLELLIEAAGGGLDIVSLPSSIGKPGWSLLPYHSLGSPHVLLDTQRIRYELGYQDIISTPDALAEAVEWYRVNPVTGESHSDVLDSFDYGLEDRLIEAYNSAISSIQANLAIARPEIHHHYAHPKTPNVARDHLGR